MLKFKFYWVAAFAVLQCMVPLLHAHIGGSVKSGVHFHVALPQVMPAAAVCSITQVSSSESIAIGICDLHKRDAWTPPIVDSMLTDYVKADAKPRKLDFGLRASTSPSSPIPSLRLPPSHAPPITAI